MSYDYDDDTNEDGPKALRDLVKKLQRDLEKVTEERNTFASKAKEADRAAVFTKLNIPPKIQRWMKDVEGTEDAVKQWVAENGEDFNFTLGQAQTDSAKTPEGEQSTSTEAPAATAAQSVLSEEDIAAYERITAAMAQGVGQTVTSDQTSAAVQTVESQLGPNASFEDVIAALKSQGIAVESSFG